MLQNLFRQLLACSISVLFLAACSSTKRTTADDKKISIQLIQVNDVYEIAPLNNGEEGGMARIATLKKKYQSQNPNTLLLMAGDFLSPSVYNSLRYEGKAIRGKQMVAAMNAAGFDLAIFGNHEFDIRENELLERINEAEFQWISSNTFHSVKGTPEPFIHTGKNSTYRFPLYQIRTFTDADGTTARIGFIGLTLPFNKAAYVGYTDVQKTAADLYKLIRDSVDAIVAITHQEMEEDIQLAKNLPGLSAILGGHEHDQRFAQIGAVTISKAMANAKSAYIIQLHVDKQKKSCRVSTSLEKIGRQIEHDPYTDSIVRYWSAIAEQSFSNLGFEPYKTVMKQGDALDGRETEVRSRNTNLTMLIVSAMKEACPLADIAILNGGSVRVDDLLPAPVTQYDILRTLPFGGSIRECLVNGATLSLIAEAGKSNLSTGGFLHYSESVQYDDAGKKWLVNGKEIKADSTYRLAIPEFLLTGGESKLGFLKAGSTEVIQVFDLPANMQDLRMDIRKAVIRKMEKENQKMGH